MAVETRVLTTHGSTMSEAAATAAITTAANATTAGMLAALPVVLPTPSALAAKGFRTRGTLIAGAPVARMRQHGAREQVR